jgi:predicted flap endonuclease-1-like 5' DNA nuclease/BMFP domain-containing protein YqiC
MWMVLAGATVFALILGWSVRGMLLTGKMRKAIVDKDVALTELDQARDEIERLFAAQRAQRGEGGSVADASARKITDLTSELQKAKTELATLKSQAARPVSAAPAETVAEREAPTIVLPPSRGGAEDANGDTAKPEGSADVAAAPEAPTLVWRNRHLEARVHHLEAQLAEMEAAPAVAGAETSVAPSVEEAPVLAAASVDEEGLAKLKWQADYLKQRVEALEAELAKAPAEAPVAAEEDANEEMARLRWRNRFLEGRLAYFEGGAEDVAGEPAEEKTGAEAMLEELEVTDTAADMTEAVEAMAEDLSIAELPAESEGPSDFIEVEDSEIEEAAFETLLETDVADDDVVGEEETAAAEEDEAADMTGEASDDDEAGQEDDSFEDVSDDEEESLAEADHADEDVLSDEEYEESDFADEDDSEGGDYDEEASDELEETHDEDDVEEDAAYDDGDEFGDEDEDGESDEDEAYDDDEEYEDSEAFGDDADDEDVSDEDDEEAVEDWDEPDETEYDADDDGEPEDEDEDEPEDSGGDDVAYESEEGVLTERPMAMNGPVEGQPDDLTLIGGIGPKIQVLLNELGVWHYDQIAEWTPENVAWVDQHLNFNGRISREGWVEQAAVLVRDAESV